VSLGDVNKSRRPQLGRGQMERVRHPPGRKPLLTEAVRERRRGWLGEQPDLRLGELQEQLRQPAQLGVSRPARWLVLRQMGLRLKKVAPCP